MAIATAAVTVGVAATPLVPADADAQSIEVANVSAVTVYYGGPDVTTANGVPIAAGSARAFDLLVNERLHGIVATGTAEVRVGRIGVG